MIIERKIIEKSEIADFADKNTVVSISEIEGSEKVTILYKVFKKKVSAPKSKPVSPKKNSKKKKAK